MKKNRKGSKKERERVGGRGKGGEGEKRMGEGKDGGARMCERRGGER